jgi:hypothetical protein
MIEAADTTQPAVSKGLGLGRLSPPSRKILK